MQKKPLEKLNVLDDFLFNRIVSTPEIGPEPRRRMPRMMRFGIFIVWCRK